MATRCYPASRQASSALSVTLLAPVKCPSPSQVEAPEVANNTASCLASEKNDASAQNVCFRRRGLGDRQRAGGHACRLRAGPLSPRTR